MREVTPEEQTLVKRVLNYDYLDGHKFFSFFAPDRDLLFYGATRNCFGYVTCLGVANEKSRIVGILGVDYSNSQEGIIRNTKSLLPIDQLLATEDPRLIEAMVIPPDNGNGISYKTKVQECLASYRQLLEMFFKNHQGWQLFRDRLHQGSEKEQSLARALEKDLMILEPLVTTGAQALLNLNSDDPVHDFLMAVNIGYRLDQEIMQRARMELKE